MEKEYVTIKIKEKLNLDITKHPASEKKVPHRHPE